MNETPEHKLARFRKAIAGEALPLAIVDLDAVDANVERLVAPARARGKKLRVATKSIRCPELVTRIAARGAPTIRGVMTYTASETLWLAEHGHDDLLLAYPTAQASDATMIAQVNAQGAVASVVCDDVVQLEVLDRAARQRDARVPVVIEVDLAYRPLGDRIHLGVRRSPLRTVDDVTAFAARVTKFANLELFGLMGYEAQVAGVGDAKPSALLANAATRAMKERSRRAIEKLRADLSRALAPKIFNGAGTGSLTRACEEDALTEVTAGSGFVDSHLFDHYDGLALVPAAFFALQVVRIPSRGIITCHGGGYVASGGAGRDRLPQPALPAGLELLPLEGAGEVQTPVVVPADVELRIGDSVFFRHAKAGELAEHFAEYLLVRGDRIEARAPTYRGLGLCFLG